MERQGSGFKKITEAYSAAYHYRDALKPQFYSDTVSFQVTLYNLNYGQTTPDKVEKQVFKVNETGVCPEKQAFEPSKAGVCPEKQAFEQAIAALPVRQTTKEHITVLFNRLGYESVFSRTEIAEILKITASPAGELIRKMKSAGLIQAVSGFGNGKYKFIRN